MSQTLEVGCVERISFFFIPLKKWLTSEKKKLSLRICVRINELCPLYVTRKIWGKEKQKKGFLHELKKNKLNYLTKLKLLFGLLYENFKLKKKREFEEKQVKRGEVIM